MVRGNSTSSIAVAVREGQKKMPLYRVTDMDIFKWEIGGSPRVIVSVPHWHSHHACPHITDRY